MKRIKEGLLKSGLVVHLPTKEMVRTVLTCLKNTKEYSDLTMSSDIWDWYKSETVLDINSFRENEVFYGSAYNEEFILSYDEIWEVTGGYIDQEYYTRKSLGKIFEDDLIMNPRRNGKSLQSINNLIDYIDYMTIRNQFKNKVRGISANNIYIDCNWGNFEEEEDMSKIEKRTEELEKSIEANEKVLSELKTTNKYVDVSTEIASQLLMIREEKELLKGYETLDDMYIANVIVNNNTVIVIALDGEKAVSKLSDDDDFNFLAGFFMNLVKLDSSVDNYFYDHSIHVALEDIKNGNL